MINQKPKKQSKNLIWIKAIDMAETLEDLDYIREKLETTRKINRRTVEGRKETMEIASLITKKAYKLIELGETPF